MKNTAPISILDIINSKATGTFGRIESAGWRAITDMHERYGIPDSGYDLLPPNALHTRATPLSTVSANGGYLDQTDMVGYLPALQAQTNLLRLGATQVSLAKNATVTPRGVTALSPTWLTNESTATTETAPTFGQITFARKNLLVCVRLSRQLLIQSDAEEIVRTELVRACGAEIDRQGIQGVGGLLGTPLGVLNMPAITTASGATLAYATLVTAMTGVATSNAIVSPDALGFLTTPTVAGVLKQRQFSSAAFPIWTGSVPAGTIDGITALSSTNCTAGSLLHGDFSRLLVAQWADGLQIDVDPFTNFQSAFVTVRLCVAVDFAVASPLSFSILTGVT
jgi:HK97 family phage major capsid protein